MIFNYIVTLFFVKRIVQVEFLEGCLVYFVFQNRL